jgi:hypothetical protein
VNITVNTVASETFLLQQKLKTTGMVYLENLIVPDWQPGQLEQIPINIT